ncbi:MAG: hypothetical protein VST64_01315 [Nitrospirota bacterium]|nr:hypothetical protein [Nitrospirota bacterium]MEC4686932.1 hypothetical protein [Nitrospirota bacterium]
MAAKPAVRGFIDTAPGPFHNPARGAKTGKAVEGPRCSKSRHPAVDRPNG